ncbi:hypothetical protein [Nocardioides sp. SYSU D00038]|uniref:hypothetical protein n=1 Tax=Nocardioides sp. SYSU D00038 TaxID=2812554 RepID=UPI0019683ADA|nr:hypothetical protein [Nocardioides sp. SYSU D00038]
MDTKLIARGVAAVAVLAALAGCTGDADEPATEPSPSAAPAPTTTELRITVPDGRASGSFGWDLTPHLGTSPAMVTWSAYLEGATGTRAQPLKVECYLRQQQAGQDVLFTADDSTESTVGDSVSLSGAGVVDPADGDRTRLECELTAPDGPDKGTEPDIGVARRWHTNPLEPIQVTITPLGAHERIELEQAPTS